MKNIQAFGQVSLGQMSLTRKMRIFEPLPQICGVCLGRSGGQGARCPESVSTRGVGAGKQRGLRMGQGGLPRGLFPCCPTVTVLSDTQLTVPCALLPRWLVDLFHNQIESKLQRTLESKVRTSEPRRGWAQVKIGPQPREDKASAKGRSAGVQAGGRGGGRKTE